MKPDREPDFKYSDWEFFIEEGVQWHSGIKKLYKFKIESNELHWFDPSTNQWSLYRKLSGSTGIYKAFDEYVSKQIEQILLN